MKRVFGRLLVVGLAFIAGFGLSSCAKTGREVTTTSLSPDERLRVRLIETSLSWAIDRNFVIELEDVKARTQTIVFQSPDEGRPIGTERFVWSQDGTYCLLLGRHFYVKDEAKLSNGELAYWLLNTSTGEIRLNADQRSPTLSGFNVSDLRQIEWHQVQLPDLQK